MVKLKVDRILLVQSDRLFGNLNSNIGTIMSQTEFLPKLRGRHSPKTGENRTLKHDKPTVDSLVQQAYQLPKTEIQRLAEALQALLEAIDVLEGVRVQQEHETSQERTLSLTKSKAIRGSIELKIINGCGPYAYLRYWSGGKHRSSYLGKPRKGEK
jgi:hypothetical protein